jgi:hypothetical protein
MVKLLILSIIFAFISYITYKITGFGLKIGKYKIIYPLLLLIFLSGCVTTQTQFKDCKLMAAKVAHRLDHRNKAYMVCHGTYKGLPHRWILCNNQILDNVHGKPKYYKLNSVSKIVITPSK